MDGWMISTTVDDITDTPDPEDFRQELEDLLDDLESSDLPFDLQRTIWMITGGGSKRLKPMRTYPA